MSEEIKLEKAPKKLIISAFLAMYIIWGTTYLGIKYAIETLPPALMGGFRFLIAGIILYVISAFQKETPPTRIQWKNSFILGFFLLLGGNGLVIWSQRYLDSGIASLLITFEPIWIVILLWVINGIKPSLMTVVGTIIGIIGMILLTNPFALESLHQINLKGVMGILIATFSFAIGSLYSIKAELHKSAIRSMAMQMIAAGILFLIVATIFGEWNDFSLEKLSGKSILSMLYLMFFGSVIAYTAYGFLLKHAHPTHVSTYAYVNPVIAIYVGWALGNEHLNGQTLIASFLLIGAAAIINSYSQKKV